MKRPRTFAQLLSAVMAAWPTAEELAKLTEQQLQTLRGAGNVLDNQLYLATDKGKELAAEVRRTRVSA